MRVIYCAGEQGRVVLDILQRNGIRDDIYFIDDDEDVWGEKIGTHEVLGGEAELASRDSQNIKCIIAYGGGQEVRLSIAEKVSELGFELFSAIDGRSTVSSTAEVGDGVIVNAESYIGPGSEIQDLVLIDSAVSVSHDSVLEKGVTVTPGATLAGRVSIEEDAYIGAGATIIDGCIVGEGSFVGSGAVVTEDVPPGEMVVGVPATPIDE